MSSPPSANARLKKDESEGTIGAQKNSLPSLLSTPMVQEEPVVTRAELWSYYLYYNGDNGVGIWQYSIVLLQSLAFAAGYDPKQGPGSPCTGSGQCVVKWGSGTKSVSSVVLITNGLSFATITLIFTSMSSGADYGNCARWMLLATTVICCTAQFATMTLTEPSRWPTAMAVYVLSYVSYAATLVFFAATFPRLARNTPRTRMLRTQYEKGEISTDEFETEVSMEKNRISNITLTNGNIGWTITQCLSLSVSLPLANDPRVKNYALLIFNTYYIILGIWWCSSFIFRQPRPGPPLPRGEHYISIGWRQVWQAIKHYKKLPFTFLYLFAYFLLADGLNTTYSLVGICQNDKFNFSFLQTSYLGILWSSTSAISAFVFWRIQKHWKVSTKTMFTVTNVATMMIPLWGMIGIWTDKFGFHNVWEFWAYNAVSGLFQAPYWAFSQTMMAELTPHGYENMFFGLFGLFGRASSIIGPNVVQAIIDSSGNNWKGFPFLFVLCFLASVIIWFGVDVPKGRRDASSWAVDLNIRDGKRNLGGQEKL